MQIARQKLLDEQLREVLAVCVSETLTEQQRELIQTLQLSDEEWCAFMHDLRELAKLETHAIRLEKIPFSIPQMANEISVLMEKRTQEKNLDFTMDAEDAGECFYLGDPKRLRQIIMALCDNAIKYTQSGGVDVVILAIPGGKHKSETLCVTVEDTGIGIAPSDLDYMFKKFTRLDNKINRDNAGAGMGLAIAKMWVQAMGGTITATSHPDAGSTFEFRLPLQPAMYEDTDEPTAGTAHAPEPAAPDPQLCVLLVEDYPANVLVAKSFLEHFGYSVDVAITGEEAVEMIKAKSYMVVLMDVQMPGMNGFEATKLVRDFEAQHKRFRVPVIGMTAYAMAGDRENCLQQGMDDYISKPFSPDTLKEKLGAIMVQRKLRQF